MSRRIFVIAGEPSGDALGGRLMKAMKEQSPDIQFTGIGGPLMEAQGLKSILPMEDLCVMGLWEVIGHLPRLLKLIGFVTQEIERQNPDAVITIDLPDFNFEVGKRLKKRGKTKAKLVHYVAPSVWIWRKGRADKISKFLDGLICLFPFEPPYFPKIRAQFCGHPLVETAGSGNGAKFRKAHGIPGDSKTLGLFFGSRRSELEKNGQTLKEAAQKIVKQSPGIRLIAPTLPHMEEGVRELLQGLPATVTTAPEEKWDAFAACDAAIAVSGTVGLELAFAGVPHVITYRAHAATWQMMKALINSKYAHLANILLGEEAIPEFLQDNAKPEKIAETVAGLYQANTQSQISNRLRATLGADDTQTPSQRAASFVLSLTSGL
jgi:lipid-A-disaccharide synthase